MGTPVDVPLPSTVTRAGLATALKAG
jgi:hypothetical protein